MPDPSGEKRTFEADAYSISDLQLQARPPKRRPARANAHSAVGLGDAVPDQVGLSLSREVILRLIDWLKDE